MKKKTVLITVLLIFVLSIAATSASAQAYYPQELVYVDAQIDVMLPMLDTFQGVYHEVNGRYYQALISHSSPPEVPVVPDGIYISPTDQPESLAYFWSYAGLPSVLAWSFAIDTYSGPDGDGYVLMVETIVDGDVWMRAINRGADTWRDFDWLAVPQE